MEKSQKTSNKDFSTMSFLLPPRKSYQYSRYRCHYVPKIKRVQEEKECEKTSIMHMITMKSWLASFLIYYIHGLGNTSNGNIQVLSAASLMDLIGRPMCSVASDDIQMSNLLLLQEFNHPVRM